jgi:hypothetical protein
MKLWSNNIDFIIRSICDKGHFSSSWRWEWLAWLFLLLRYRDPSKWVPLVPATPFRLDHPDQPSWSVPRPSRCFYLVRSTWRVKPRRHNTDGPPLALAAATPSAEGQSSGWTRQGNTSTHSPVNPSFYWIPGNAGRSLYFKFLHIPIPMLQYSVLNIFISLPGVNISS